MARLATLSVCALPLSGCAIPTISTEFDPDARDTNLRYADRQWLEDLIDEQRQLVPSSPRGCSVGSRCTGRQA